MSRMVTSPVRVAEFESETLASEASPAASPLVAAVVVSAETVAVRSPEPSSTSWVVVGASDPTAAVVVSTSAERVALSGVSTPTAVQDASPLTGRHAIPRRFTSPPLPLASIGAGVGVSDQLVPSHVSTIAMVG